MRHKHIHHKSKKNILKSATKTKHKAGSRKVVRTYTLHTQAYSGIGLITDWETWNTNAQNATAIQIAYVNSHPTEYVNVGTQQPVSVVDTGNPHVSRWKSQTQSAGNPHMTGTHVYTGTHQVEPDGIEMWESHTSWHYTLTVTTIYGP